MLKKNKLIKDFLYYFSADFFIKGFMFISLPLLSRVMSPEEYGKMSLFVSATGIFFVFISLNIQNAVSNRLMTTDENFSSYLYSCLITVTPLQIFISILLFYSSGFLSPYFGLDAVELKFVILTCLLLFYFNLYSMYLQAKRNSSAYTKINILVKVVEIILVFILAAFFIEQDKHYSKIYAQVAVLFFSCVYFIYKIYEIVESDYQATHIKAALLFAMPLIPHVLANSMLAQADRFLINFFLGTEFTGIYSFSYNLSICILVFILAWNSSWQPKLYKLINDGREAEIHHTICISSFLILSISISLISFSRDFIYLVGDVNYSDASNILPILVIGNSFIHPYLSCANFIFHSKKTIFVSVSTILSLLINLALNYYWIPIFGIDGAAWATVFSYTFLFVFNYIVSRFLLNLTSLKLPVFFIFLFFNFSTYFVSEFLYVLKPILSFSLRILWLVLVWSFLYMVYRRKMIK